MIELKIKSFLGGPKGCCNSDPDDPSRRSSEEDDYLLCGSADRYSSKIIEEGLKRYEAFRSMENLEDIIADIIRMLSATRKPKPISMILNEARELEIRLRLCRNLFRILVCNLENRVSSAVDALVSGSAASKGILLRELEDKKRMAEEELSRLAEIHEDITRKLYDKAQRDPMTKLFNAREFKERAKIYLRGACGGIYVFGVIDIAEFKKVNDSRGHLRGDQIIEEVAFEIGRNIRLHPDSRQDDEGGKVSDPDLRGRIGGDEFAFLLRDFRTIEEVEAVSQRFQKAIEENSNLKRDSVVVNIGAVAIVFKDRIGIDPDSLYAFIYNWADQLMYRHKRSGRGLPLVGICEVNGGINVIRDPKPELPMFKFFD